MLDVNERKISRIFFESYPSYQLRMYGNGVYVVLERQQGE